MMVGKELKKGFFYSRYTNIVEINISVFDLCWVTGCTLIVHLYDTLDVCYLMMSCYLSLLNVYVCCIYLEFY